MIELILVIIVIELGIIIRNTSSKESWSYLFFQTSFYIAIWHALIFFRAFLFALSNHSYNSSYFSFLSDLTRFLFKSDHLYCFDINSQNTRVFARKNPRVSQREGKTNIWATKLIILQTNKKNKMIIRSIIKSIIKPLHNNNNLFFYFFNTNLCFSSSQFINLYQT